LQAKKYNNIQTLFLKIQNLVLYKVKIRGSYMKNLNIIFKIVIITTIAQENLLPGFAGRGAQQASAANQTAVNEGITENFGAATAGGTKTCCGNGNSCQPNPTTGYIPPFNIQILSGTAPSYVNLNGTTGMPMLGTTITNFTGGFNLLTVHIFPPSNTISGSTITPSTDDNYIAFFTLKDFTGANIYKQVETFKSSSLPHYIGITGPTTAPTQTTNGATSNVGYFAASPEDANYVCIGTIFPPKSMSKMTTADQQKVINGMSPIVQNFLFTMNNNEITVTHISGAFGSEASSGLKLGKTSSFSPAKTTLGTDALQPFNISFNDNGTPTSDSILLTFKLSDTHPKINFNTQDLANGIILDVVVFPSTSGNNYSVVATIKTLDGTKLRKKYSINSTYNQNPSISPLSQLPASISLSQGDPSSPTLILTSNILSNAGASSQYFNFISPLNLSFIISQPTGSQTIQALMI
jgi:hypothetical protein